MVDNWSKEGFIYAKILKITWNKNSNSRAQSYEYKNDPRRVTNLSILTKVLN